MFQHCAEDTKMNKTQAFPRRNPSFMEQIVLSIKNYKQWVSCND